MFQLRWGMLFVMLAVCTAVPAKREVFYYNPSQQPQHQTMFFNPQPYQPQYHQSYQQP